MLSRPLNALVSISAIEFFFKFMQEHEKEKKRYEPDNKRTGIASY